MTKKAIESQIETLEARRSQLILDSASLRVQSASSSFGGSAESYSNLTPAQVRDQIAIIDRELRRLRRMLKPSLGQIQSRYAEYCQ